MSILNIRGFMLELAHRHWIQGTDSVQRGLQYQPEAELCTLVTRLAGDVLRRVRGCPAAGTPSARRQAPAATTPNSTTSAKVLRTSKQHAQSVSFKITRAA